SSHPTSRAVFAFYIAKLSAISGEDAQETSMLHLKHSPEQHWTVSML
ncbi:hypothetical protein L195_g046457, partial [Trifolium pratense]